MNLSEWIQQAELQVKFKNDLVLEIEGVGNFLYLEDRETLIDAEYDFILSSEEFSLEEEFDIKYYVFQFGKWFYYSGKDKFELKPFINLGPPVSHPEGVVSYSFLGVHGQYEMMSGSSDYKEWIDRAKFLGINTLGIIEKNTLAGSLPFYKTCLDNQITPILGETITLNIDDEVFEVIFFVKNMDGWKELLEYNYLLTKNEKGYLVLDDLWKTDNLIIVIKDTKILTNKEIKKKFGKEIYFKFDLTLFKNKSKQKKNFEMMQDFISNYSKKYKGVYIQEAYYPNPYQARVKELLSKLNGSFFNSSTDQYIKSTKSIIEDCSDYFSEEQLRGFFITLLNNTNEIKEKCSELKLQVGGIKIPDYKLPDGRTDKEEFFMELIEKGWEQHRHKFEDEEVYLKRIDYELSILIEGNFLDYFLMLWDMMEYARQNNIMTGIGRGSVCGCLIALLLNITGIDPIKYGLLFERFLNPARIKKSPPDIDIDFESRHRDEIKTYIENKYELRNVASIGTYTRYKLRSSLLDVGGKIYSLPRQTLLYMSNYFDEDLREREASSLIFRTALKFKYQEQDPAFYDFVQNNYELIHDMVLLHKNIKTQSIHPSAVIVSSNKEGLLGHIPIKMISGEQVSEWEGQYIDMEGTLKNDVLGVKQFDKLKDILNHIEETTGEKINLAEINLKDKEVFKLFQDGNNGDLFHFGSKGLSKFCFDAKPISLEEMTAMISVYRPGPIGIGSHRDYLLIKHGHKEPFYDHPLLEPILKDTFSILVYQEQIMKIVQVMAGFTLGEADDIRRAMSKIKPELMKSYKDQFINGCLKNEVKISKETASIVWDKLQAFAAYCFNMSHALAYSMIAYQCQWLKCHYPVQYWSVALNYSDEDHISQYISEINRTSLELKLEPPDINYSDVNFTFDNNSIYWSLPKIKFVAEAATRVITEERLKNGKFYSLEEFVKRTKNPAVNKRVIENLIFSGSFDSLADIKTVTDRAKLFVQLSKLGYKNVVDYKTIIGDIDKEYKWILYQKNLSGYGFINYDEILYEERIEKKLGADYIANYRNIQEEKYGDEVVVGGSVLEIKTRVNRKGEEFSIITMDNNDEKYDILLWPDVWTKYKSSIKEKTLLFANLSIKYDDKRDSISFPSISRRTKIIVL